MAKCWMLSRAAADRRRDRTVRVAVQEEAQVPVARTAYVGDGDGGARVRGDLEPVRDGSFPAPAARPARAAVRHRARCRARALAAMLPRRRGSSHRLGHAAPASDRRRRCPAFLEIGRQALRLARRRHAEEVVQVDVAGLRLPAALVTSGMPRVPSCRCRCGPVVPFHLIQASTVKAVAPRPGATPISRSRRCRRREGAWLAVSQVRSCRDPVIAVAWVVHSSGTPRLVVAHLTGGTGHRLVHASRCPVSQESVVQGRCRWQSPSRARSR